MLVKGCQKNRSGVNFLSALTNSLKCEREERSTKLTNSRMWLREQKRHYDVSNASLVLPLN